MRNYWIERNGYKKEGWVYSSSDFRILGLNDDVSTIFSAEGRQEEEVHPHNKLANRERAVRYDRHSWLVKYRKPGGRIGMLNCEEKAERQQNPKCPMCGRIKAVSKKEEHLFYCSYCEMLFDDRED